MSLDLKWVCIINGDVKSKWNPVKETIKNQLRLFKSENQGDAVELSFKFDFKRGELRNSLIPRGNLLF